MADLRKALQDIGTDDSVFAPVEWSSVFLQTFVRAYCSMRKECPKAVAGDCPLDAHAGGIGDLMAELDRVGQALNTVNAHLEKVAHHATNFHDS